MELQACDKFRRVHEEVDVGVMAGGTQHSAAIREVSACWQMQEFEEVAEREISDGEGRQKRGLRVSVGSCISVWRLVCVSYITGSKE